MFDTGRASRKKDGGEVWGEAVRFFLIFGPVILRSVGKMLKNIVLL